MPAKLFFKRPAAAKGGAKAGAEKKGADLAVLDVSRVPAELARRGALVELIGPNVPAHELAHHAGTIDYEVLTNLGRRAFRRYVGG